MSDLKEEIVYHPDSDDEFDKLLEEQEYVKMKRGTMNYDIESLENSDDLSMTLKDRIIQDGAKIGIDTSLMADDILKYLKHVKETGYDQVPFSALTAYGKIDKLICEQTQMAMQMMSLTRKLEETTTLANSGIQRADYVHRENGATCLCSFLGIVISCVTLIVVIVLCVLAYTDNM